MIRELGEICNKFEIIVKIVFKYFHTYFYHLKIRFDIHKTIVDISLELSETVISYRNCTHYVQLYCSGREFRATQNDAF